MKKLRIRDVDPGIFTREKRDQVSVKEVLHQALVLESPWSLIYGWTGVSFHKIRKWHGLGKCLGIGAKSPKDLNSEKTYLFLRESGISREDSMRISGARRKTPIEIFESQKRMFRDTFNRVFVKVFKENGDSVVRIRDLMEGDFHVYPLERFIKEDETYNRAGRKYEFVCSDPASGVDSVFVRTA